MKLKTAITLVLISYLQVVQSEVNCAVEPVVLSFGNVTVLRYPKNINAPFRTLNLQFGERLEPLAIGFGTTHNATFVPDSKSLCNSSDPRYNSCIFWRGGLYSSDRNDGSSFKRDDGTTPNINGSVSNDGYDYVHREEYENNQADPLTNFAKGWDKLTFSGRTIDRYPLTLVTNSSFPFSVGVIGGATDSVFFKMATETGNIPSKSFGLDYGVNELGKETTGELVLGGYNSDKTSPSEWSNYTISGIDKGKPCPLQVTVNSIKWGDYIGDSQTKPFTACIELAYHTMILPKPVQQVWQKAWSTEIRARPWENTWEYQKFNLTSNTTLPTAPLTISIEGLPPVTIPAGELFKPATRIDDIQGGYLPVPGSVATNVGHGGFADRDPALTFLGGPLLSQLYLVVDYETNTFSLAPIKRPVLTKPHIATIGCDAASGKASASTTSVPRSNTTTVVGAVIGVVAAFLIAGLGFFFWRRRRNQSQATKAEPEKDGVPPQYDDPKTQYISQYGLPAYVSPQTESWNGSAGVSPLTPFQEPVELGNTQPIAEMGDGQRSPTTEYSPTRRLGTRLLTPLPTGGP